MNEIKEKNIEDQLIEERLSGFISRGDVVEVPILLRKANKSDLETPDFKLRYGQPFVLRNHISTAQGKK